jgi:hypothetical protein
MGNRKCPALVDGKECGLALILVERDIDAETEIYECPRGHRKNVMIGEIEKESAQHSSTVKHAASRSVWSSGRSKPQQKSTNARWATAHTFQSSQKLSRSLLNYLAPPEI